MTVADTGIPEDECMPNGPIPAGAIARKFPVINKRGLHARASAKFVQLVEKFDAKVQVTRCGETVNGDSIMGLMMLAASPGTTILALFYEASCVLDETLLHQRAEKALARWKQPRHYQRLDALPRTGTGKLIRKALAARYRRQE